MHLIPKCLFWTTTLCRKIYLSKKQSVHHKNKILSKIVCFLWYTEKFLNYVCMYVGLLYRKLLIGIHVCLHRLILFNYIFLVISFFIIHDMILLCSDMPRWHKTRKHSSDIVALGVTVRLCLIQTNTSSWRQSSWLLIFFWYVSKEDMLHCSRKVTCF